MNFTEKGKLNFNSVVYPDYLDAINFDENNEYSSADRYRVELKNSSVFLKNALEQMTDDKVDLIPQSKCDGSNAIILKVDENETVSSQGFRLKIDENAVTVSSKFEQGVTNGIFTFLEDYLGCMFLAPDCDYIPKLDTLKLEVCEKVFEPAFKWRSVYSQGTEKVPVLKNKSDYLGWHTKLRLNGAGGDNWGSWCHSSFRFISPDEYFKDHPEYFSLYKGKRVYEQGPVSGQLCWTNEDVYKIISEKLFSQMAENPDVHIWDVSQMDTWINRGVGCQCKKCREIDDREGSQMGSLLTFINRLADECAHRFPDNYISTLAYNYTAEPPKTLRPRDNVIIKLCLMPGDVSTDYENPMGEWAKEAHKIVSQWGKVAKHILIWDYNVDYHGYYIPFPLVDSMTANNRFYLENNVYGIFHQMAYETRAQDAELHAYLFSKLMWNKDADVKALAERYIEKYYGDAAPYISEYYSAVQRNVHKYRQPLYIYAQPDAYRFGYLSDKCLKEYNAILDKAVESVKGNEELTKRVRRERLGVLYVKAKKLSLNKKGRISALEEFYAICKENGITDYMEGKPKDLDNFYNKTKKEISTVPPIKDFSITFSQIVKFSLYRVFPFLYQ
ncbi:MAG: DUF4838 domain-containing protein [Eubacterium sp.]